MKKQMSKFDGKISFLIILLIKGFCSRFSVVSWDPSAFFAFKNLWNIKLMEYELPA